jgi:hypothetical protein
MPVVWSAAAAAIAFSSDCMLRQSRRSPRSRQPGRYE